MDPGDIQTAECSFCGTLALCELTLDDDGAAGRSLAACAACIRQREPDAPALQVMPLFDPGPAPMRGQTHLDI